VNRIIWLKNAYIFWWLGRLIARLQGDRIDYINGPETLPPPLTREEEEIIFVGLEKKDAHAKQQLIVHNLRLVVYIARKFESTGICVEDLISIGTIGLIKAVNTFCPKRNIKLATYASRCIENEILMYLRKCQPLKNEISIDEPLNIDWDGNELLLSDILGTESDCINRPIEQDVEKKYPDGGDRAAQRARALDHAAAFWILRRPGENAKRGGGYHRHLPVLYFQTGKAHYQAASQGIGKSILSLRAFIGKQKNRRGQGPRRF
jgi:RNA polymerase sporulation-specific sigma factor